jgi:hypothetical protein
MAECPTYPPTSALITLSVIDCFIIPSHSPGRGNIKAARENADGPIKAFTDLQMLAARAMAKRFTFSIENSESVVKRKWKLTTLLQMNISESFYIISTNQSSTA